MGLVVWILTHSKLRGEGMAVAPPLPPGCGRQCQDPALLKTVGVDHRKNLDVSVFFCEMYVWDVGGGLLSLLPAASSLSLSLNGGGGAVVAVAE